MAWGDGQNNDQNPWRGSDQPPDLDAVLRKLKNFFGIGGSGGGTAGKRGPVLLIVLGLLVVWFLWGIYQVDQRERAVVLRFGIYYETLGPGLHWRPPIIDSLDIINVTELRTHSKLSSMLTRDENIVEVNLSVQYVVSSLKDYLLEIVNPDRTLIEASESALRHVVGSSSMDDVLVDRRAEIQAEVQQRLQLYLHSYKSGLRVVKVNIQEAYPPQAVRESFDDAIKAREDKNRLRNEAEAYANSILPQARGESKRLLAEAKGYKEQVIANARGEAARFVSLHTAYRKAPEVMRQRLYIEAVQDVLNNSTKVLVDLKGGEGNLLYLPLDRMVSGGAQRGLPQQQSQSSASSTAPLTNDSVVDRIAERVVEKLSNAVRPGSRSGRRR